jgi:hypothetical protein
MAERSNESHSKLNLPLDKITSVVVIVNNQIIINGLDIANESLTAYSKFIKNLINFNINMMRMTWNPFLPLFPAQLKNEPNTTTNINPK